MVRPLGVVVVAAAAFAGCLPSFDDFYVVGSGRPGGPCGPPQILIAIERLDQSGHGRVARLEILQDGSIRRCGDTTGRGELVEQPFVVAAVPPSGVAVATWDEVVLVDGESDRIEWQTRVTEGSGMLPHDLFVLQAPSGTALVAATFSNPGYNEISALRTVGVSDGAQLGEWQFALDGSFPINSMVVGMEASPFDPGHVLVLKSWDHAGIEVDPFEGVLDQESPYAAYLDGSPNLTTISALYDGREYRAAWIHSRSGEPSGIYTARHSTPDETQIRNGGLACTNLECAFVDAVPYPTQELNTGVLAICDVGDSDRMLVRFASTDQECEVLLRESDISGEVESLRMSGLDVAL